MPKIRQRNEGGKDTVGDYYSKQNRNTYAIRLKCIGVAQNTEKAGECQTEMVTQKWKSNFYF